MLIAESSLGRTIGPVLVLMTAAVVALPLFRRFGLGLVLGCFACGMPVDPSFLGYVTPKPLA